jgi:hypothetical protein
MLFSWAGDDQEEWLENGKHIKYCSTLNRWVAVEELTEDDEDEEFNDDDDLDNINFAVSMKQACILLIPCSFSKAELSTPNNQTDPSK